MRSIGKTVPYNVRGHLITDSRLHSVSLDQDHAGLAVRRHFEMSCGNEFTATGSPGSRIEDRPVPTSGFVLAP